MHDVPLGLRYRLSINLRRHPLRDLLPVAKYPNVRLSPRPQANGWRCTLAAGCIVVSSIFGFPVEADEFDPLTVYEEARGLNDQWQVCVANFIKGRLQASQKVEQLAKQALHRCRSRQDSLNHFLIKRIGGTSASNVMVLLRERYQSELIVAISELRTRDWDCRAHRELSRGTQRYRTDPLCSGPVRTGKLGWTWHSPSELSFEQSNAAQ
jgi:hypothetical protein